MGVDWALAVKVGGAGFGMVFALLIVLAFAVWITGRLDNRRRAAEEPPPDTEKGA